MRTVDIDNEDNSLVIDTDFTTDTFYFYPEEKKFKLSSSIKDDVFYNTSIIEYRVSAHPIELQMRTIELSHEPPLEYSIRDGVVLESEIIKNKFNRPKRVQELKEQTEWMKIPLLNNLEVNLHILSIHSEIISKEENRRFLRQSLERIKLGLSKTQSAIEKDKNGLRILTGEYGKQIWYPNVSDEEFKKYLDLPEEKRKDTPFGKKIEYAQKFNDSLFNEKFPNYVGISETEFKNSDKIIKYIQKLVDEKEQTPQILPAKNSKTKEVITSLLITLLLSWVASLFVNINPFLIFILVQIIAFLQSIIGNWFTRYFLKS